MFLVEEVPLPLSAETAESGMLAHLMLDALDEESNEAFETGRELLVRAGVRGLSKRVQVQVLPPYRDAGTMVIPVRWVATGPAGGLFPQLDGNLEIVSVSPTESTLRLVGSYRPPLGEAGASLDRVALNRVAQATFRSFLRQLRRTLEESAKTLGPRPDRGDAPNWVDHS